MNHPIEALKDPASDALMERQRQAGPRVQKLRAEHFDPAKLPGFVAGWKLDALSNGAFAPLPGSDALAAPAALSDAAEVVDDEDGRKAVAIGKETLAIAVDPKMIAPGPITVSAWVKTKPGPFMGRLFEVPGVTSFGFKQGGLNVGAPNANWSSAMLSSWTHLCVTWDGTTVIGYRNGVPLSKDTPTRKIALGKVINLGGADPYGNAEVQARDVMLYRGALSEQQVGDLFLWGRHGAAKP